MPDRALDPRHGPPAIHRVLAGPGSGKTRLLTDEIRTRLAQGLPPDTILGITFTRRAAEELHDRVRLAAIPPGPGPWTGTFHQLAHRLQRELHQLPAQVDLDRLIPDATALLQAGARLPWVASLQFIGVDEAQDLDTTQVELLKALRTHSPEATLFLVGDPDQAIYGFRDASARFLLHPDEHFHHPVQTRILGQNHRSARQIVEMAQAILCDTAHPDAPCRRLTAARPEAHPAVRELVATSPDEEARRIFQELRTLLAVGVPAHEQAILVRTRAQLTVLDAEAARWGLPTYTPPIDDRLSAPRRHATPPHTLTLLTIHQAKGCEWTVVFVAGCHAGLLPHTAATTPQDLEEERRLLYVAVTRAKQLLWLCRYGAPSPFLRPATPARDPFTLDARPSSLAAPRPRRPAATPPPSGWGHRLRRWLTG